jgi:hypothetical protein
MGISCASSRTWGTDRLPAWAVARKGLPAPTKSPARNRHWEGCRPLGECSGMSLDCSRAFLEPRPPPIMGLCLDEANVKACMHRRMPRRCAGRSGRTFARRSRFSRGTLDSSRAIPSLAS